MLVFVSLLLSTFLLDVKDLSIETQNFHYFKGDA